MRITTRTTALTTALLLTLGLAACDGGDDSPPATSQGDDAGTTAAEDSGEAGADAEAAGSDFCTASGALDQLNENIGQINPADADESLASLRAMVDEMSSAEAPAEVSDAVDTVTGGLHDLIDGVEAALEDPDAPEAMSDFGAAMEGFHSEEVFSAYDTWAEYVSENC